jgi:hypothetical protein
MGKGADNIETIASALADFQANDTSKQQAGLEAMKTPDARVKYNAQVLDKTNELNQLTRTMILNNICYLDSVIDIFKKMRDSSNPPSAKKIYRPEEAHLDFLYAFKSAIYKKKLDEGYKSKVDVEKIVKDFDAAITKSLSANKGGISNTITD